MIASWDRICLLVVREVRTHGRRSLATIGVIAAAAALLVAVLCVHGSLTGSVDRLTASVMGEANFDISAITDTGFDQSMTADVQSVPGVAEVVPLLSQVQVSGTGKYLIFGVAPDISKVHSDLRVTADAAAIEMQNVPDGVAAGSAMGWVSGQRVAVGGGIVTVASVLDLDLNGGRFVVAPLPLAQRLTDRVGRIDSVLVVARPQANQTRLRADLEFAVEGRAVVVTPNFHGQQARQAFALIQFTLLTFAGVAFVVAAFLVFNTMSMTVTRRRPQISMLRALGARRRLVAADLFVEAAITGMAGAVVGAPIGVLAGHYALGRLPPLIVDLVDAQIVYQVPYYAVPLTVMACVGASVAATAAAVRIAYRIPPIEALASVDVSRAERVSMKLRIATAVGGVTLFVTAFLVASRGHGPLAVAAMPLVFVASVPLCVALGGVIVGSAVRLATLFGRAGRLASASVARSPRRVWAATLTVTIAVAMAVALTGINANLIGSATASFASVARSDLWISATPPNQLPAGTILPVDMARRLDAIDGIARTVPNQWVWVTIHDRRIMLQGLAPGTNSIIASALSDHQRELVLAGKGIALSRDVGRTWGVDAGDTLDLPTPTGAKHVRVIALVDVLSSGVSTIGIALPQLQQWYERPGANSYELTFAPTADRRQVTDAVRRALPTSVSVYTGQQAVEGAVGALEQTSAILEGVQWIIAVVAAIALFNTLMLSVLERRREIGVLRAIGASKSSVSLMVLAEAAAIGIVGAVMGIAVGLVAHYLGDLALEPVATIPIRYAITPWMAVYAATALSLCLLGALLPARNAAHMNIVRALTPE